MLSGFALKFNLRRHSLGGDQDGGLVGVSQMASAAGGKRAGGGVHHQEGVYMDQLHVRLGSSSTSCFPRHQKCAPHLNIRVSKFHPSFLDSSATKYSICPHLIMLATSSTARNLNRSFLDSSAITHELVCMSNSNWPWGNPKPLIINPKPSQSNWPNLQVSMRAAMRPAVRAWRILPATSSTRSCTRISTPR